MARDFLVSDSSVSTGNILVIRLFFKILFFHISLKKPTSESIFVCLLQGGHNTVAVELMKVCFNLPYFFHC